MKASHLSDTRLIADQSWLRRIDHLVRGVLITFLIAAALMVLTPPKGSPPSSLRNSHLVAYSNGYNVAETYGGTNPVETCTYCEIWGKDDTGTASPPSTNPDTIVNNGTGDLSDSYTLFSVPDPSFNLDFKLSYDAQYAQLQTFYAQLLGQSAYGGEYGFGWRTDGSTSAVLNTQGQYAQVELPSGSEVEFQEIPQNGNCQAGDSIKKTPGSQSTYCGADRIDASFGSFNNYHAFNLYESGGRQVIGYNYFGQVVSEGNKIQPYEIQYEYSVPVNTGGCVGPTGTANCTIAFDITGHSYVVAMQNITVNNTSVPVALQVLDPQGHAWTFGNVASSNLGGVTDPNGNAWQFHYDSGAGAPDYHDITQLIDPDNNTTTIAYTPAGTNGGLVSSVTDGAGNQTTYSGWNVALQGSGSAYQIVVTHPDHQVTSDSYQLYSIVDELESSNVPNDTSGGLTQYSYDNTNPNSPSETITDPMGFKTTQTTDGVGNVITEANNYGTTTTEYNGFDEPCWSAPPTVSVPASPSCSNGPAAGSGATLYSYDPNSGDITQEIDPSGVSTYYAHDGNGELCWQSTPGSTVTGSPPCSSPPPASTRYYYSGGLLAAEATPDGAAGTFTYDTTTYTYNQYGEILTQVTPNGNVSGGSPSSYTTTYHYDNAGRLYQVDTPGPTGVRTTSVSLDAAGNVLTETDPMGNVTTKAYDADNRLCWSHVGSVTNPTCTLPPSASTDYSYNADTTNPTATIDPDNNQTTYTYYNASVPDKATTVKDGLGNITSNIYDADGNLCVTGAGSSSLYGGGFNAACQFTTGYTYDQFDQLGNVTSTENPNGHTTTYAHQNAAYPSDVTTVTPPLDAAGLSDPTTYTYDLNGRLHVTQEPNGNDITVTYTATGQRCWQAPVYQLSATCSSPVPTKAGSTSWAYYNSGLPWIMSDSLQSGSEVTYWTYDAQGQETSEIRPWGTVGYGYDTAGDNTCVAYPSNTGSSCVGAPTGTVAQYVYDKDARMTSMSDWLGNTFSFAYDANSNLHTINYPTSAAGWVDTYNYDSANNLLSRKLQIPTYSATINFSPNADNHFATQNGVADGYNALNQVTSVGPQSLNYNADGEVTLDLTNNLTGFWYAPNSELESASTSSGPVNYVYDANGNRCQATPYNFSTCSSTQQISTNYGWTAYDQLCFVATVATGTCASPPLGSSVTQYMYDGNNLRVSAITGGVTTNFSYDTQTRPGQPLILEDGTNAYLYGPGDFGAGTAPLEQISLSTSTPGYLFNSANGVEGYANSAGLFTAGYSYAPFGAKTTSGTSGLTPFSFQGGYTDPTGLIYFINRYYDPSTDQFLSVDPSVATTGQPYAFTADDPLNATDSLGLQGSGGAVSIAQWKKATAKQAALCKKTHNRAKGCGHWWQSASFGVATDILTGAGCGIAALGTAGVAAGVCIGGAVTDTGVHEIQDHANHCGSGKSMWDLINGFIGAASGGLGALSNGALKGAGLGARTLNFGVTNAPAAAGQIPIGC